MSFTVTCPCCKKPVPPEELVGLELSNIPKTCTSCRAQDAPAGAKS